MITPKYIILIFFSSLFVCGLTQYYGYSPYPYNYGYSNYGSVRPYPVSTQNYYRPSPCRSSCNSCQYLPCYNNYVQRQPYYQPYAYYTSRQYGNPYVNYFGSNKKSDIYSNVPVEIIDDESVLNHYNRKQQDEYANVPVEIIDDDGPTDFWKRIPFLPKSRTSSYSNYTVSQGKVVNSSHTENKPIRATIVRQFQPIQQNRQFKIDFLNGAPSNGSRTEEKAQVAESTTVESEEETTVTTETNEINGVTEDSEDVSEVRSWF